MNHIGMTPDEWSAAKSLVDQHIWLPPRAMYPPIDEDEHIRETYAIYGLAMSTAQKLEMAAVNLLALSKIVGTERRAEEIIRDPWEQLLKKTMGDIVKRLKAYLGTDPQFVSDLDDALMLRNTLAHGYMNLRCDELFSFDGRNQMISELQHIITHFEDLITRIRRATQPFERGAGYPANVVDASLDIVKQNAAKRDAVIFGR